MTSNSLFARPHFKTKKTSGFLLASFLASLALAPDAFAQSAPVADQNTPVPETFLGIQRATQTDHLDFETVTLGQSFDFNQGAGSIGPVFQYSRFDQRDYGNADLYRPEISGSYKFNNEFALNGVGGVDHIVATDSGQHTIPTYNAYATFTPDKTFSMDVGSNRTTFANMPSLQMGIAATYFGGDVNFMPNDTLRFTGRGNEGLYNDGNERQFGQVEGEQRVLLDPAAVFVGAQVTGIHYEHTLYNGYFDPARYGAAEGLFRIHSDITHGLSLDAGTSLGVETASPVYSAKLTYDPRLKLSYVISNNVTLDGTAEYYASKLASDSGFSELIFGLGLHYFWR